MLCPLDYRYGRKEMKDVLSEENRLSTQLRVEAALARAHAKVGDIPVSAAEEISRKAIPSNRYFRSYQADRS